MYIAMLTRIRNAVMARKAGLKVPYTRVDLAIAQELVRTGYLASAERKGRSVKKIIDLTLKYDEAGEPAIAGIAIQSKPSQRVYRGYREIRNSRQGYGRYILSTPQGILSNIEAKKAKVGGELLFEIW